jgi:hypothetical protein
MTIYYGQDGYVTKVITNVVGMSLDDFLADGEAYADGDSAVIGQDKFVSGVLVNRTGIAG